MVTAMVAGLVIAGPVANAISLDLSNSIANATYVLRWTVAIPVAVWIGAMYAAWKEPAEHWLTVILNAAGMPGTLLAIALAVSR
jgi:hypothetical protein